VLSLFFGFRVFSLGFFGGCWFVCCRDLFCGGGFDWLVPRDRIDGCPRDSRGMSWINGRREWVVNRELGERKQPDSPQGISGARHVSSSS
jgi:hypothetical protein